MQELLLTQEQIENASRVSANSRSFIEKSKFAGCFYCTNVFPVSEIEIWIDDNEQTPLCPKCGIDSVLGDAQGYPINKDSLELIRKKRFKTSSKLP